MKPGRKAKKSSKRKGRKPIKVGPKTPPAKEVEIQRVSHGSVKVDKDKVDLSISGKDHMKWKSKEDWLVVFPDGSPFEDWFFHQGNSNSGPIREGAEEREYKYIVAINGALLDPGVVIGP
jgi:hypothetical protein